MARPDRFVTVSGVELAALLRPPPTAPPAHAAAYSAARQRAAEFLDPGARAHVDLLLEIALPGALDDRGRALAVGPTACTRKSSPRVGVRRGGPRFYGREAMGSLSRAACQRAHFLPDWRRFGRAETSASGLLDMGPLLFY